MSKKEIEKYRVHKSKDLVESRFSLSLLDQKVLDLAISKINPRSEELQNPYRISAREFEELGEVEIKYAEREMMKAVKTLRETTILKHDPSIGVLKGFGIISKFEFYYSRNKRSAQCDLWFDDELRDDLLAQKKYSEKKLGIVWKIRGKWTYKLYELCNQYRSAGRCQYGYNEFREIIGVPANSYKNYIDLIRRIIRPALKEIDDITDLHVDFDVLTINDPKGFKVPAKFEFYIREEQPQNIGESAKKKKGRKPKVQKKEQQPEISDHIDTIYSKELQDQLIELGIMGLKTYKDEGITEEVWKKALAEEPSQEPRHIITTARRIITTSKASKKKQEEKAKTDAIFNANEKFWRENEMDYSISGNPPYLQPSRGPVIMFNDPEFVQKIEPFKLSDQEIEDRRKSIEDRRKKKGSTLISGTSVKKRTKGRRATD